MGACLNRGGFLLCQVMKGRYQIFLTAVLLSCFLPAHAVTIVVSGLPNDQLRIRVGSTGSGINVVTFNVPVGQIGNGVPITGTPQILVRVTARSAVANSKTATLTANSLTPMMSAGGDTIPFTTINWTTSDGDIPAGAFDGSNTQTLLTFQNSRSIENTHTFHYSNVNVVPIGTYTGRVTYTLSMP